MSNKTCIILIGPPCSGKSVVGKITALRTNAEYVSSGDIARQMAKYDAQISRDLSDGKMAPEDKMRKYIETSLWHHFYENDKDIVILDGFPRFGDQAVWLLDKIGTKNINIYYVLFNTPLSAIIERSIHRNRDDDKSLEQRLRYYYNVTYNELCAYINIMIDTTENSVNECSVLLENFIKEVTDVKNRKI